MWKPPFGRQLQRARELFRRMGDVLASEIELAEKIVRHGVVLLLIHRGLNACQGLSTPAALDVEPRERGESVHRCGLQLNSVLQLFFTVVEPALLLRDEAGEI